MEFYTYLERTENLPGYRPGGFIYDLVLKLINIAKTKAPNVGEIERIVTNSKEEFQAIYIVINKSQVPRRDKNGNIIYKTVKGTLEPETDTITFHNIATKNLIHNVFYRILPTFLIFIQEIEKRGYIKESQKANIIKILGDLNQMYKNPKNKLDLEKFENHLTFQIESVFDRDAVLNDAEDAIYLVQQLFDRKTSKGNDHDKKMYNETFRIFKKLKEYVNKIQETEGNEKKVSLSQDEDDLLTDEAELQKIKAEQEVIRVPHSVKKQNFELPSFAKTFTRDPETGKYAYLRDVDSRKKEATIIGASKGEDISGLAEQRDFFGYTKVFNEVMMRIIEQKKNGALRTLSSEDKRDLQNYFAGRKPFIQTKNKLKMEDAEVSWYDRFEPFDESKWFFKKPEGTLLKAICQARVIATGKRFSYDIDLIYDDFIYLLRTFLNGNVKTSSGDSISLEKGAQNEGQKIKEVVSQYFKEANIEIRGETSKVEKVTKKEAALQRSIEIEKEKQSGERELSKKDIASYDRKIKELQDELSSINKAESELLTDIFSLEKMQEIGSDLEVEEVEDIQQFAQDFIRIINIKKTKNLITPKISPKPKTDVEIKNILSRILKRSASEITEEDIKISKEIFGQDSNTFFNRKAFLVDYIQKLKGLGMTAVSIKVTEPIQIPKNIKDNKKISEFLKNVFLTKNYTFNDEEIEAAKNVLKTVDVDTIDKNYFKVVYDAMLKEKVAELELERLEKFKETSEKELLISDLSDLSTNMYSNNLYLQMTDLTQEIKFSHKITGLVMILKPENKKDNRSSGEFTIYVSRKNLDEFIKKNPYIIDSKNKNPLNNKQLIIENELYVTDNIPVIRGTYDATFLSSPMLTAKDQYDIIAGYSRSATTAKQLAVGGMTLDKMLDMARLAGKEKTRIKTELLTRARKRALQMKRREAILSGKTPKKRITNNYLKTSKSLLDFFEKQKSILSFNTDKIEDAIKEYDRIINEDQKIIAPKVREKAANQIRIEFKNLYKDLGNQKNQLIGDNLKIIKDTIIKRRLTFLKLVLKANNPPIILFDKVKYDGSYQNSYVDLEHRFNVLFDKYTKFVFTKPNTLVEGLNQIEDASKTFSSLLKTLTELANLISTPEIEEEYGGRSTRGMRLEKPIQESYNPNYEVVKVKQVGSKYKKIQFAKPQIDKVNIIEEIIKENEIK